MKAISEAISVVIIYSTLIAITLFMAYYAFSYVNYQASTAEYYYIRQVFLSSAESIPVIVSPMGGGSYKISVPEVRAGIGWRDIGRIVIYVNNSKVAEFPCKSIYSRVGEAIVSSSYTIYGIDKELVDDMRLLPRVRVYYDNGATFVELDTCRLAVFIDKTSRLSRVVYYIRLFYIDLEPRYTISKETRLHTLSLYLGKPSQINSYDNVYGFEIQFIYNDGRVVTITPRELGVSPPVMISMITYNVVAEVG